MSAEDPLPYRSGAWLKSQGWRIVKLRPSGWQTVDNEPMLIVEEEL